MSWCSEGMIEDGGVDRIARHLAEQDCAESGLTLVGDVEASVLDARVDSAPGFEDDYPPGLPLLIRAQYDTTPDPR